MERVLPKTLDYTDVLPLAVESRSRRRTFFPTNGATFKSNGANIIRIDLSADALLDTQHSYLRFDFTPTLAGQSCGIDTAGGHAFIRRMRIEQSGTVLEDINNYNRLMGAVVLPCQSGVDHHNERSITEHIRAPGEVSARAGTDGQTQYDAFAGTPTDGDTAMAVGGHHQLNTQVPSGTAVTFSIPLNTGLLNCDKLLPLMLMSAPLTIEIELATTTQPVCWSADPSAAGFYSIDNVRYIANLIEVGQDVSGQLRMVQELSGGVLTLAGQTYRHFTGLVTATAGDQDYQCPCSCKEYEVYVLCWSGC
jgi:hypothetical protein